MLGKNFLTNNVVVHAGDAVAAAQDGAVAHYSALDLAAHGARRVTALVHVGAIAANATMDLLLQTSDTDNNADFADVPGAAVTGAALAANKVVAVEVDTNSVRLKRYVRIGRQRKTANSQVLGALYVLGDLRQPGRSLTRGDVVGATVGQETS